MLLASIGVLNDYGMTVLLDEPGEEEPGLHPLLHPLLNEQGGFPAVSL